MKLKCNLDEKVYQTLCEGFADGSYRAGQPLSPAELCERYGTSRTPIIQALKRMVAEGIIRVNGTGKYSIPEVSPAYLQEMFETREMFECACAQALCENISPEQLAELETLCEEVIAARRTDAQLFMQLDTRLHSLMVRYSGNATLDSFYQLLSKRLLVATYSFVRDPHHSKSTDEEHRRMVALIREGKGEQLRQLLAYHISAVRRRLAGED